MRPIISSLCLTLLIGAPASAEEYTLASAESAPEGLSEAIAAQIAPQGYAIGGPKRAYATLWLVKSASVPAEFQATSAVKYPFATGQLLGVLSIPKRAEFQDFRGNALEAGTYTLRYGRQPMDGNHIGTSDLADFLVAIPAEKDEDPAVIAEPQRLAELSSAASGTTHPAILSLQPVVEAPDAAALTHDEEREFWILQVNAPVMRGAKADKLPLRLIVVGVSEG
jgi:hypothetical protein